MKSQDQPIHLRIMIEEINDLIFQKILDDRMRNFNIAFGNIAGSNIFNYLVLAIADLLYINGSTYYFNDSKVVGLTVFGAVASIAIYIILLNRNKWAKAICAIAAIACYIAFLTA